MRTSGTVTMWPSRTGSCTLAACKHLGDRVAHQFADAQLALRAAGGRESCFADGVA